MKPEAMAMILRATIDANAALTSVLAIWQHHEIGTLLELERMRSITMSLSREADRLRDRLAAAMKCGSNSEALAQRQNGALV